MCLIWENPQRIVMDADWWAKASPIRREFTLWHEEKHGDFVRRHGMTLAAGIRNVALDLSNRLAPLGDEAVWRLLRWTERLGPAREFYAKAAICFGLGCAIGLVLLMLGVHA